MTRYARWGFALVLLPLVACGGNEEKAANPTPAPTAPPAPQLSSADTNFINQAAMSGLAEVQEGQIAAQRGGRPAIRQFGQRMVTDHTQANQQLMQLAQSKGVTPPAAPDPQQMTEQQALQRLRGRAFDRAYVRDQVKEHQQAVQLFQQEVAQGTDPDVKSFAQQTLPTLQQHLQTAESLSGPPRH